MIHKPFTIAHYFRGKKIIDVQIEGREKLLHIERSHFEQWLENTERLEYITDVVPDHTGEPTGGDTGTMTIAEYWESDYIFNDLVEYIIYHQPASYFNIKQSIDRVTDNSHVHPTIMTAISKFL